MSDGIALFYVKDGIVYPLAVKKDELEMLDIMIPTIIQKAYPMLDHPIGKAEMIK